MSWLERRSSGRYHVVFRLGNERFKRSLKTSSREIADAQRVRLDEHIHIRDVATLHAFDQSNFVPPLAIVHFVHETPHQR